MFQPFIALIPSLTTPLMSACSPCILMAHLSSPPLVHSPRNSQRCLCLILFFSTAQGFFFFFFLLEVCETWKLQCGLFISWFYWFVLLHLDNIVAGLNFKCVLWKDINDKSCSDAFEETLFHLVSGSSLWATAIADYIIRHFNFRATRFHSDSYVSIVKQTGQAGVTRITLQRLQSFTLIDITRFRLVNTVQHPSCGKVRFFASCDINPTCCVHEGGVIMHRFSSSLSLVLLLMNEHHC